MKSLSRAVIAAVLSVVLVGCSLISKPAPENTQARAFALQAAHDLVVGNAADLTRHLAPQLQTRLGAHLGELRAYLPRMPGRMEGLSFRRRRMLPRQG